MATGNNAERKTIPRIWMVEYCYKHSRWIAVITTCRHTKSLAMSAWHRNPVVNDYYRARVVKFERERNSQ